MSEEKKTEKKTVMVNPNKLFMAMPKPETTRNHSVELVESKKTITVPAGSLVIVVDLMKEEYPLSSTGKSITISRATREFVDETPIFYSLNVNAVLPK